MFVPEYFSHFSQQRMEQSIKDAIEDKDAAKKDFYELVCDVQDPWLTVTDNLTNIKSKTKYAAKFEQSTFMALDSNDCLDILAHFLAFENMKCSNKKGNVCVAFAVIDTTLYLAANPETEQHLDNEMKKLKSPSYQKWLSLLDPSEEGRKILYQSMGEEFKTVFPPVNSEAQDNSKVLKFLTDPELGKYVKNTLLPISEVVSSDAAVKEVKAILDFFHRLFDDGDFDICLLVELHCLHLLLPNLLLGKHFFEVEEWYDCIKNYAAWKGLETYTNPPTLPSIFHQLRPHIEKRKNHWKVHLDGKMAHFKETENFKKFEKLKNALEMIRSYCIVEVPDYPRDASNASGASDLHCEIKLFKYLQRKEVVTSGLKFYISRPCCGVCTCYFFGCVGDDDRPDLIAASLHYCPQALTESLEEKTKAILSAVKDTLPNL
ncbi:hypothetical protein BC833DRAFT_593764 [Globomyces pollinis-pini]|nr:hypothetical protein BC833DRAFT_593764 [Globomyces pollinis-pini]